MINYRTICIITVFAVSAVSSVFPESRYKKISSFTTSIADQSENVKKNISIACDKINGVVIQPGTVFSFNKTVGEGSAKNGFVNGRVMYRDLIRMEPGGGLCQVSSTLFNALLLCGTVIIERHRHYQPVTYVPLGLDATIKYGKKNLRIKNPYSFRLKIHAVMTEKSLVITITSERKIPYRYEIFTEVEESAVPLKENSEDIRQGMSVFVFRKRYSGNSLVDSAMLYKDYYPPVYLR